MRKHGVDRLVFSSTAAVFGHPNSERIDEDHPKQPINPYGASKLMVERILADAARRVRPAFGRVALLQRGRCEPARRRSANRMRPKRT